MTKLLLALGLMTAAGSSGAIYIISGNGQLTQDGYCGKLIFGSMASNVMSATMLGCQQQLNSLIATASGNHTGVEACHLCIQKFKTVPETSVRLPIGAVRQFLDGTQALREQFRIEDYERAQQELQRSISPEPTR
jgi:hypothetical protein